MPRVRFALLLVACSLLAAAVLLASRTTSGTGAAALAGAETGVSSNPVVIAARLVLLDAAMDSSLLGESPKEPGAKSRHLGKRVTCTPLAGHGAAQADWASYHASTLNWISSYLPASEFCIVLSRFRI